MADEFQRAGEKFAELVKIMARLRAPGGCPWDRKQSFETIKPYLLEETYEVMDAVDDRNWASLTEELGDLLLQPVFFAEMAREAELFSISDSLDAMNEKLIRRPPHVFADGSAKTAEDVKTRWDEIKKTEKQDREKPPSLLDDVPRSMPALAEADKIGQKVGKKGFEWPDVSGVVHKLQEEAAELAEAHAALDQSHVEHEIGDLLFNLVNLARYLGIDPEQALRKTNARFRRRFAHIENQLRSTGSNLEETPLERMEELWQEAKRAEKAMVSS